MTVSPPPPRSVVVVVVYSGCIVYSFTGNLQTKPWGLSAFWNNLRRLHHVDSVLDPSLLKTPIGFRRLWIGLCVWGGVGVRSQGPRVPRAVRESGPVERLEEVTEGQRWCPRGHGPLSLILPHDFAAECPRVQGGMFDFIGTTAHLRASDMAW